ncbi:lamin tail domain-containing protein, partial [uncultured Arthrobacter sp.]|uniref:lamin tail domain-containing protein n=1 Tax=uncultured Arthrobacter sp. TaxID=114050 RepID=UPI0025CF92D4
MINSPWKGALCTALAVGMLAAPTAALPASAQEAPQATVAGGVVINEAFVTGGSAAAPYLNKFVELYNPTDTPVSVDGWSLQYRSAAGTTAPTGITALAGTIPARGYFLVRGSSNGPVGEALPAPDIAGNLNTSGSAGTILLARQATAVSPLPVNSVTGHPAVVDLLGYGTSNTFEGTKAAGPGGGQQSMNRTAGADTDNNAADFTLSAAVTPTNSTGTQPPPPPTDPPAEPPVPGAVVPIRDIQGTGTETPLKGTTITTRGKVTAAYPTGGFAGFYLQTPGTGAAEGQTASDAVFVFSPETVASVAPGDYVEVTGTAGEFFGLTQLTVPAGGLSKLTEPAEEVKAVSVPLPATETAREALEGMLLQPAGDFT